MNWLRKVAFGECAVMANKTGLVGAQSRTSRTALNVLFARAQDCLSM